MLTVYRCHPVSRVFAVVLLAAFLAACTRQVARPPLETRHFRVNWEDLPRQRVEWAGWVAEGVPLTPVQWPLQASLNELLAGDFVGVIDRFDLRFHSATLEGDVLEKLFERGFLPAYLRVRNTGEARRTFRPEALTLEADGEALLFPLPPAALPRYFEEIDWARIGSGVVVAALTLALILLARQSRGDSDVHIVGRAELRAPLGPGLEQRRGRPPAPPPGTATQGLLTAGEVAPGEAREGFVFYRLTHDVADWQSLRLVPP